MIGQDGETAANQHHQKKKIEEVAVADPERKTMRPGKIVGVDLRDGRNMGIPGYGEFDPCRERDSASTLAAIRRRPNPDAKTPIRRVVDSRMRRIKLDHHMPPGTFSCIFRTGLRLRSAAAVATKKMAVGQLSREVSARSGAAAARPATSSGSATLGTRLTNSL